MTDLNLPATFAGTYVDVDTPDWGPLSQLCDANDLVLDQFMWMGAILLEDGRTAHAYKHVDTRCYLHLAEDLTAFRYHGESHQPYAVVPLGYALRGVFCQCRELGYPQEAALQANEALIERHTRYPRRAA